MADQQSMKSPSLFRYFEKNTVVFDDGDETENRMYIILEGKAGVYKNYEGEHRSLIAELKDGDFFGETALFLDKRRAETVVSHSEMTVIEITRDTVYKFFGSDPVNTFLFIQTLCLKTENLNSAYERLHARVYPNAHKGEEKQEIKYVQPTVPLPPAPPRPPSLLERAVRREAPLEAENAVSDVYAGGSANPETPAEAASLLFPAGLETKNAPGVPEEHAVAEAGAIAGGFENTETPERNPNLFFPFDFEIENAPEVTEENAGGEAGAAAGGSESAAVSADTISSLFPSGHKHYTLPEAELKEGLIFDEIITCPICGKQFHFPIVRSVLLRVESTDYDLRRRHNGIDVTHYLVTTCPKCLFSAIAEDFDKTAKMKPAIIQDITAEYKQDLNVSFDNMDADTIFARLYLALIFTNLCYDNPDMMDARLWLNISWMYRDCGDPEMELLAVNQALQSYRKTYETVDLNPKSEQSVCQIIGELYYKLGDIDNAKRFFFIAKTNKGGSKTVEDLADDRLAEIKKAGL